MDDLVLWSHDKTALQAVKYHLQKFAEDELQLTLNPACLNQSAKGLSFLGYLIFPGKIRLARRSRIRFIKKLHNYESKLNSGIWSQKQFANHVLPLLAFAKYADTNEFRKKVLFKN